jgi:5'-3' exonuclease
MGIPSYYKKLLDRHRELVSRARPSAAKHLYFDFNCLVYQCLRDKELPPFDGTDSWETTLLDSVCKYVRRVWSEAGSPADVFIAVDGVVPMAKIRQQRMRRFKSVWMAAEEERLGARSGARWDTNAITPGTAFMDRLAARLQELGARHGWLVSDSHEPGEGEQKIMSRIRQAPPTGGVVVYGLDGDLIVLSLMAGARTAGSWHLMREAGEMGALGAAPEDFVFLDIKRLKQLVCDAHGVTVENYACAMSLLGNDFVPHSLSVKLRDGGHDILLNAIAGKQLVDVTTGQLCWPAFREIWMEWAKDEKEWIATGFAHKYKMRPGAPKNDYDRRMLDVTNLPVTWGAEKEVWSVDGLKPAWTAAHTRWCFGASTSDMSRQYMQGLQWVWDYYTGREVDMTWYYPWFLSPLWSDLVGAGAPCRLPTGGGARAPISETEQLAMVLPEKSWGLLRDPGLRQLPQKIPHFWPTKYPFFSVGRRWFWECEAMIPILTVRRLRSLRGCI